MIVFFFCLLSLSFSIVKIVFVIQTLLHQQSKSKPNHGTLDNKYKEKNKKKKK